jgi:hypothetical protein
MGEAPDGTSGPRGRRSARSVWPSAKREKRVRAKEVGGWEGSNRFGKNVDAGRGDEDRDDEEEGRGFASTTTMGDSVDGFPDSRLGGKSDTDGDGGATDDDLGSPTCPLMMTGPWPMGIGLYGGLLLVTLNTGNISPTGPSCSLSLFVLPNEAPNGWFDLTRGSPKAVFPPTAETPEPLMLKSTRFPSDWQF